MPMPMSMCVIRVIGVRHNGFDLDGSDGRCRWRTIYMSRSGHEARSGVSFGDSAGILKGTTLGVRCPKYDTPCMCVNAALNIGQASLDAIKLFLFPPDFGRSLINPWCLWRSDPL